MLKSDGRADQTPLPTLDGGNYVMKFRGLAFLGFQTKFQSNLFSGISIALS